MSLEDRGVSVVDKKRRRRGISCAGSTRLDTSSRLQATSSSFDRILLSVFSSLPRWLCAL